MITNSQFQNAEVDEIRKEVVICVLWRNGKLAAAYFDCSDEELYIIQDIVDINPDFILTHSLMAQIKPKYILSMGSRTDKFIQTLSEIVPNISMSENALINDRNQTDRTSLNLQLLSAKEYCNILLSFYINLKYKFTAFNAAKATICSLKLPQVAENATEEEILLYLQSIINFEQEISIHALGILLMFLNKHWNQLQINNTTTNNGQQAIKYLNINLITLKNLVFLSEDTYKGLQIFKPKGHPANFKRGFQQNNEKEGLSLFKLFDRCKSKMGSFHLRQMMYFPTNDINLLRKRQQFIEFCLRPINRGIFNNLIESIKRVSYINGVVNKLQSATTTLSDWKKLMTTISNILMIYEICEVHLYEVDLFAEYVQAIDENLYLMLFAISKTIQFDKKDCFFIKQGVDRLLDTKKQYYMELHNKITVAANHEIHKMPEFVTKCCIVYIPEIGYLVYVTKWSDICSEYDLEPFGFKFQFKIDKSFYYKSAMCLELDICLGDIHKDIDTHESRILYRLSKYIINLCHYLFKPIKIVYEMDCLISMAEVADSFNYVKPELTNESEIIIEWGRHPLVELNLDNFVSNDYKSYKESERIKIITGPNSCGKSIYLKQVAIITYMAHIGSYVPAKYARISMLSSIHTRMNSSESTAFKLSAFMKDLRQISQSVLYSLKSSLILIDEFGKGTTELDGKSLLVAVINHFISRQSVSPHLIVSTHFLDTPNLIDKSEIINYYTFEYFINNDKNVVFLYKLIEGIAESSLALQVAVISNLNDDIINRASELLKNTKSKNSIDDNNTVLAKMFNYEKLYQTLLSLENPTIEQIACLIQKAYDISNQ